jgi:ubiquitin C-terminal hydrolase
MHESMLALKECLLAELKRADGTSDITASGEGYDEILHSLMQTFWDMFDSGQITQTITCSICTCITTREESFRKLLVQFPDSHHEATPTNQKCTLNSLIQHHFKSDDLPNYEYLTCGRRTLATRRIQICYYPVIICIVLGRKMNDETRITLAVNYPLIDLNLCTFFGSHEGTVDSKYNLIATVNHKPSKKNDGHYTAVNNSPTLGSWYKYDNHIINLVKFLKGNTNSVLMDFQKTASILFYVDVKYVSICHNNLCNDDEVIDVTGPNQPPGIDQLQDSTSSLS